MECSDCDSDYDSNTPPDISSIAKEVTLNLLPKKSKLKYDKQYDSFKSWCSTKHVRKITENVMLAYKSEKSKVMKSPTLWSIFSMLKTSIRVQDNVDIGLYNKLIAFLKQQGVGYKPKKSKVFTKDEVKSFLLEAPDELYLIKKVALIFGIAGACRRDELTKLTIDDVEDKGSLLVVNLPDSKTNKSRMFTITNVKENGMDYLGIYRKYLHLRSPTISTHRLFIKYNKGIVMNQVIGVNTMGKIPKDVAEYLKLPNPALYTGHCFRRTSATMLVNEGGNMTQLKQHGGWKSSTVAEGYIEQSLTNKIDTAQKILGFSSLAHIQNENNIRSTHTETTPTIEIKDCQNCTFNISIVSNKD